MKYGPILVIGGRNKGRFGLYDDDEDGDNAIVYLYHSRGYKLIPRKHLAPMKDAKYWIFDETIGYTMSKATKGNL